MQFEFSGECYFHERSIALFHQIVNKNILMSVSPPAGGAAFLPTTKVEGISPRSGELV